MSQRIALITGAGRGIGRSIACALANTRMKVAVTARTTPQLDEVVQDIEAAGGEALAITGDLTDRASINAIVDRVETHWGAVEVLVNNAGVGSSENPKPIVEFDDSFWDLTFAVNVTAPYLLTKRVLPNMIAAKWGRIINISSINARVAATHGAAYTASKHAIAGLTKATAMEIADKGITANAICPGVTATLMNDKRIAFDAERLGVSPDDIESKASPLGRRLSTEEISPLAAFLASDGATAINGQLINVCGGRVMS